MINVKLRVYSMNDFNKQGHERVVYSEDGHEENSSSSV
jgi:hypothetical protein